MTTRESWREAAEPPHPPTACKASDKHVRVRRVTGHSNSVAQQSASGKRTRRVDRQDPNACPSFPLLGHQRIDKRTLAHAGRARKPDHLGWLSFGIDLFQNFYGLRVLIIYGPQKAGCSKGILLEDALEDGLYLRQGEPFLQALRNDIIFYPLYDLICEGSWCECLLNPHLLQGDDVFGGDNSASKNGNGRPLLF